MRFLHQEAELKNITTDIALHEYCNSDLRLPIDGAYAKINGSLGPKINKTFAELFFVISGTLQIEQDDIQHILQAKDMYIVPRNTKHKITGSNCEAIICCAPQFKLENVEFCS